MRVAAYYRVSTEEQRDRQTIETQRHAVRQYAEREGYDLVREYLDDGVSGTVPLPDRPGGAELLRDGPGVLLVYRLDRIGRDTVVTISALQALKAAGWKLQSSQENLEDLLLTEIKAVLASEERRTLARRSHDGMRRKAKAGGWLGGTAPYGYRVEGLRGEATIRPCEAEVVPGVSEAEVVRRMFRLSAEGKTCQEIADYLNALGVVPSYRPKDGSTRGIRTRQIATKWRPGRVARVLAQTTYMGEHTFKFHSGYISRQFPALVDAPTWHAAQATKKKNTRAGSGNANRLYLLKGKIICERCGRVYVGQTFTDNRGKKRYYYTMARGRRRKDKYGDCKHKVIRALDLEAAAWADVSELLENPGAILGEVEAHLGGNIEARATLQEEVADYTRRLRDKDAERDRVVTAFRRGLISDTQLERQLAETEEERTALAGYLSDLEARLASKGAVADQARSVAALLERFKGRLTESVDAKTKRAILNELVERIDVYTWEEDGQKHQRLQIVYRFDVPSPARSAWASTSPTCGWWRTTRRRARWRPTTRRRVARAATAPRPAACCCTATRTTASMSSSPRRRTRGRRSCGRLRLPCGQMEAEAQAEAKAKAKAKRKA